MNNNINNSQQSLQQSQNQSINLQSQGDKKSVEIDINDLFSQLMSTPNQKQYKLVDNQKQDNKVSESDTIDQSTLMALLLYLGMDSSDQEFFNYVQRTLEKTNKETITRAEFKQILLQPEISFQNLKNDEMTNIFKVFDRNQKGSFSSEDFMFYYKQTPEYTEMSQTEQAQQEQLIRKDFEIINPGSKEITPIEFFKIISHSNKPPIQQ